MFMMKAEALEKLKCKTKTDEGTDTVSDPSDVSVDTSKTGDELIQGEENGASASEVCASLLEYFLSEKADGQNTMSDWPL